MEFSILQPFIETAHVAADAARGITRKWFRTNFDIDTKPDNTPVTIADEQTEEIIKSIIAEQHPQHNFFGEEHGWQNKKSEWTWVIDPIDGTKSFSTGMPSFGTLIALCHYDQPVIGIIDQSILQERWVGIADQPSTFNDRICQTRSVNDITQASLYSTTPDMFEQTNVHQFEALSTKCKYRVFGGDCYSYGLLTSGHTDIVCEATMNPHDFLALVPIVTGAGGCITDWWGNPLTLQSKGEVLACANDLLHQQALEILSNSPNH